MGGMGLRKFPNGFILKRWALVARAARPWESWWRMAERVTLILKNDVAELENVLKLVEDLDAMRFPPTTNTT